MLEDRVRYVHRILARLVSILMMSLPLPKNLSAFQELDLLPEKIAITDPVVFVKNRASACCSSCLTCIYQVFSLIFKSLICLLRKSR